jgi:formylglycine-generating enzyme required for sulfatase activity
MLGNVWEWVEDYYNERIFADPEPPVAGETHVLKGASFVGDVKNATWLTHAGGPANGWDVGLRVVMEVPHEN